MFLIVIVCCLTMFVQLSFTMRIDVTGQEPVNNKTEIRCYCNLPACITTSYMCKSEGLGCFSDILANADVNKASHGCLDLLQSERQNQCKNEPSSSHSVGQPRSLLLCCYRDLCNHVDNPETRQRYNDSVIASSLMTDLDRSMMLVNSRIRQPTGYSNAEVWFRAATIAVPICGALILLVLIALAVRILQSDAMDDKVLAAKLRAKRSGFSPVSLNRPNFVHHMHNHDRNDVKNPTTKKIPLLFHHENTPNITMASVPFPGCLNRLTTHGQLVNVLHSCEQRQKNEANAKLNLSQCAVDLPVPVVIPLAPAHSTVQTEPTTNLIDLKKSSSPCNNNFNIYHQEDSPDDLHPSCALLSSNPSTTNKLMYKKPLVITWSDSDVKASNSQ